MACCLMQWTHFDLSLKVSCGIHLRAISQEVFMSFIRNKCSKITLLTLQMHFLWVKFYAWSKLHLLFLLLLYTILFYVHCYYHHYTLLYCEQHLDEINHVIKCMKHGYIKWMRSLKYTSWYQTSTYTLPIRWCLEIGLCARTQKCLWSRT